VTHLCRCACNICDTHDVLPAPPDSLLSDFHVLIFADSRHSVNCTTGARDCEYPDVSLTLRDRRAKERALPGAQVVWSVNASDTSPASSIKTSSNDAGSARSRSPLSSSPTAQLVLNHQGLDPFDTLGIKMQFKSRELFHYCKYHCSPGIISPHMGQVLKDSEVVTVWARSLSLRRFAWRWLKGCEQGLVSPQSPVTYSL
jgi:hypothetical protein